MTTPLETVKVLNYDHHRRMTILHNERAAAGTPSKPVDDSSYEHLLDCVPKDRKHILEIGSASGGQWDLLLRWAPEGTISGLDLYEPAVLAAQVLGLPIYLGFVEKMDMFARSNFDLVCSRHVMEHLGDVDAGIEEIKRVLAPGGFSAHVTPDMEGDNEPAHLNKWKQDRWVDKWEEHGFTVIHATKLPFHGGEVHIVCTRS